MKLCMKRLTVFFTLVITIAFLISMKNDLHGALKSDKRTNLYGKTRSPFVGKWAYKYPDSTEIFSLNIVQTGNKLSGSYCDVFDNGNRMDCADEDRASFTLAVPKSNSFTTSYISAYGKAHGLVKITVSGKHLIWQVIRRPSGENYSPRYVTLTK